MNFRNDRFSCEQCATLILPEETRLQAEGQFFHADCFRCSRCHHVIKELVEGYMRGERGNILCVPCGSPHCAACKKPIVNSQIINVENVTYHPECFACVVCGARIQGEHTMNGTLPLCLRCSASVTPIYPNNGSVDAFNRIRGQTANNGHHNASPSSSGQSRPRRESRTRNDYNGQHDALSRPRSPELVPRFDARQTSLRPLLESGREADVDNDSLKVLTLLEDFGAMYYDIEAEVLALVESINRGQTSCGEGKTSFALLEARLNKLQTEGIDSVCLSQLEKSFAELCRKIRKGVTAAVDHLLNYIEKVFPALNAATRHEQHSRT